MLNWRPLYDLDEALRETIAWYRGHFAKHGDAGDVKSKSQSKRAAA
jgi:dTDP-D-glucose 4,6-dehydratase